MFSVSAAEVAIVVVLAIVILGPKRLPIAARWLGKMLKQAKGVSAAVKRELDSSIDEDQPPSKSESPSK